MIRARRHVTRIGRRNQVTLPVTMLRDLGLGPGEPVEVERIADGITIRKTEDPVTHAFGLLHRDDAGRTPSETRQLEESGKSWRAARAARDDERIRSGR